MDGVTFRVSLYVPKGFFALDRHGSVSAFGRIGNLSACYRTGDVVIINQETYNGLMAEFARDVTPKPALTLPDRLPAAPNDKGEG